MAFLIECRAHTVAVLDAPIMMHALVDVSRTGFPYQSCIHYRLWERLPSTNRPGPWCPVLGGVLRGNIMPFSIPAGTSNVIEVSVQSEYASQVCINRWFYRVTATISDFTGALLLETLRALWRNYCLPHQVDQVEVKYYIAKVMAPIPIPEGGFVYDRAQVLEGTTLDVGSVASTGLPAQANATIRLNTNFLGRSHHGSKRITGIPEEDTTNNNPNLFEPTFLDIFRPDMTTLFTATLENVGGEGVAVPVIASLKEGAGEQPTNSTAWGNWTQPITEVLVNEWVGSQNSRKAKVGS